MSIIIIPPIGGGGGGGGITVELDPLSLHLDQNTPQTFTGGQFSGTGNLRISSGTIEVDPTDYQPSGNYATTAQLSGYQPSGNYATEAQLSGYATTAQLSGYQPSGNYQPSGDYATNSQLSGYVLTTRTVAGKQLSGNITLVSSDIGAGTDTTVADILNNGINGVLYFGGLAVNTDNTKFNVGAVKALFATTSDGGITYTSTYKSFNAQNAIAATYRTQQAVSYIGIDSTGTIIQQTTPFSASQLHTVCQLGILTHADLATISGTTTKPNLVISNPARFDAFLNALGPFNISGNVFSGVAGTMRINKTAGTIFTCGRNYLTDKTTPDEKILAALTPATVQLCTSVSVKNATSSVIDQIHIQSGPNSDTLVELSNNTKWAVLSVYSFASNNVAVTYGSAEYGNASLALAAAQNNSEGNTILPTIAANGVLRCWIAVRKGGTSLTNTDDAVFMEAPRFAGGTAGPAGIGGTTTLQQAYLNSSIPQISITDTLGEFTIHNTRAADTSDVFSVTNIAGVKKFSITGAGVVTAANLLYTDQSTPQTLTGGAFTGTGLIKITNGTLGVDTTSYQPSGTDVIVNSVSNQNGGNALKFWQGTAAQYAAIGEKDADTLYFIV